MYIEQEMVYSEERGTWNLFVNGEWYYEGTYEECEKMYYNNLECVYGDENVKDDEWYV